MKMLKKMGLYVATVALFILTATLTMGCASAAELPEVETETATTRYTDVSENQWFFTEVETTSELGIFNGYSDGSFRPYETVTEAEAMTAFFNASKFFAFGQIANGEDDGTWFSKAVNGMTDAGLVNWTFAATSGMLRENVAYVAASYLNYDVEADLVNTAAAMYADIQNCTTAQMSSIGACAIENVMVGKAEGTFGTGDLSRAELAAVIYRMLVARGIVADDGDSIIIEEPEVPGAETPDIDIDEPSSEIVTGGNYGSNMIPETSGTVTIIDTEIVTGGDVIYESTTEEQFIPTTSTGVDGDAETPVVNVDDNNGWVVVDPSVEDNDFNGYVVEVGNTNMEAEAVMVEATVETEAPVFELTFGETATASVITY